MNAVLISGNQKEVTNGNTTNRKQPNDPSELSGVDRDVHIRRSELSTPDIGGTISHFDNGRRGLDITSFSAYLQRWQNRTRIATFLC